MKRYLYRGFKKAYLLNVRTDGRITKTGFFLIVTASASAIIGVDTRQTLGYQVFTFLVSILAVALIWSLFFRGRFSCVRMLPPFGTVGEPVSYTVRVRNETASFQKGLSLIENTEHHCPTFEEFTRIPEPGEEFRNAFDRLMGVYRWRWHASRKQGAKIGEKAIPDLPPGGECEVRIELTPRRRGYLRLTGFTIVRPDPFGLLNAFAKIEAPGSMLILPKRYPVPALRFPGNRRYQSGGIAMASSVGESDEFVALRDYRPGDPLRRIHWRSWARAGKPVVKEFQDEFFVRHALVLDTFTEEVESEIFETAVSVASSFACSVRTQDSLLDLMFVGPEAYCFTSGRGLAHTEKTLQILASVSPCRDRQFDILTSLVSGRANLLSGCICILLTWDEKRRQFVRALKALCVPLLVLVVTDTHPETLFDLGPMGDTPGNFHVIETGKIRESLAHLSLDDRV